MDADLAVYSGKNIERTKKDLVFEKFIFLIVETIKFFFSATRNYRGLQRKENVTKIFNRIRG